MANRQKICTGKKSDSSCTCDSNHECQNDTGAPKHDINNNNTIPTYNKENKECSPECINCKLIHRLYILLEEIVDNRKNCINTEQTKKICYDNDTRMAHKNKCEETLKIKENRMKLPNNDMDDKKYKVVNVYNNNAGSNKLSLHDSDKAPNPNGLNKKDHTSQVPKTNENKRDDVIKKQNQVDFGCQCACLKKDSSTQDESMQEETNSSNDKKDLKKYDRTDTAVNTDTQMENLVCSLSNDPMFREAMKLVQSQSPNVVVLSNGCSCCNKCNTPRISVTTNTSDIIVNQQEFDTTQIYQDKPQENNITIPKNIVNSPEPSTVKKDLRNVNPTSNMKSQRVNSIKDIPRQSINTNDFIRDTTFIVPEETEYTVASAVVPKSGKNKATPKSKKRKSKASSGSKEPDTHEMKINSCCQTDYNLTEEKYEQSQISKKLKETCCDPCKSNLLSEKDSKKNTAIKNTNIDSCNCTDVRNFIAVITELCAQMNKTNEKSDEKVPCECNGGKHSSTKTPSVAPAVVTPAVPDDDCLEIHRLAEKIAEIHLKSNQNKSGTLNCMPTNSDCDLNNCPNLNPINIASDITEECYCNVCPCKKTTKYDRKDVCPVQKERRCRTSINSTPRIATRKLNEMECAKLNKWTQEYPSTSSPQKCNCSNYECVDEREIECLNYNNISDYSRDGDNCQIETCPQLRRIIKDCLCGSKNCYCHNAKLNELKTTAKLERLADEVINTITPCNCSGQSCTCTNNAMGSGLKRYTTRQVCFSSIYHENQQKITNNTGKGKKLFDKDVNGNPCLNGSKTETNLYIKNLLNTKPASKNKVCLKKVIPSSTKKLKSLTIKPLLPIPNTPCTQINCINSLFPEIYQALSKIKQLTNWEILPQEIVEIVIDKILKREIKNALQHMRDGVFKINANDAGDNENNTNILNLLLEDNMKSKEDVKEFKNNILDKRSEQTKQTTQQYYCSNKSQIIKENLVENTINLMEDSNNNIQSKLETFDVDQNNFDTNKKPILVQINIEKQNGSRKCNTSSISLSQKKNKIYVENSSASLNESVSSSSIYITEKKLGSIKNLTSENKNSHQNWDDNDTDASSILSVKEANQPISININIQMDKEGKLNLKDSFMNTDAVNPKDSSISSLPEENTNENTQTISSKEMENSNMDLEEIRDKKTKSMDDLQEKKKSMVDLKQKKKSNVHFQETNCLIYHRNESDLPLLDDFLAMNKKMRVKKIKTIPKNINKTK